MGLKITGTGSAYPKLKITNNELAAFLDTSDEWIRAKTGIQTRAVLSDESLTDIAADAALKALENAGMTAKDIDLVLCSTICGDTHSPSQAFLIAERLGINAAGYDINAACNGFVYALDCAAGHFARGRYKKILIVAADHLSRFVDWSDRATCVLFGDGAAAVVAEPGDDLLSLLITARPDGQTIRIPYVGGGSPFYKKEYEKQYLNMAGPEVYKFAVSAVAPDIRSVLAQAEIAEEDIDFVLLHQANKRIVDSAINTMSIDKAKYLTSVESTGNISGASVSALLDNGNRKGKFKKGALIVISAFGAGLTTSACVLRWSK